ADRPGYYRDLSGIYSEFANCDISTLGNEGIVLSQDGSLKGARRPNSISTGNDGEEEEEDFQPRIIPYKPVKQSQPKKLF
ncbi:hypothetical protein M9458_019745, partial [Cirrhinus mrigala]